MCYPPERGDDPRALASGLSYVQLDKHRITLLYNQHHDQSLSAKVYSRSPRCLLFFFFFFFFFFAFVINDEMMNIYFMSKFYNYVCFHRRSKSHQSLCLLLCTVMSSLNKFSYLISSNISVDLAHHHHEKKSCFFEMLKLVKVV